MHTVQSNKTACFARKLIFLCHRMICAQTKKAEKETHSHCAIYIGRDWIFQLTIFRKFSGLKNYSRTCTWGSKQHVMTLCCHKWCWGSNLLLKLATLHMHIDVIAVFFVIHTLQNLRTTFTRDTTNKKLFFAFNTYGTSKQCICRRENGSTLLGIR